MSKRSKWCEFSTKERKEIYKRDNNRCIICNGTFGLGIAHVFASRAHGGKGCKENGVLLCANCHGMLDNGNNTEKRIYINNYCCNYLYKHYGNIDKKELIFDKWRIYEKKQYSADTIRKVK